MTDHGAAPPGALEPAGRRRYQSVSPLAVAAIACPSVSRKLNRPAAPAASAAAMVQARAAAMASPARSRRLISAHRNAESTIASSDSSAAAPAWPGSSPAASSAADSGQPSSRPLWLNSQRPSANGAAACSPAAVPSVADLTAASTARDLVTRARSGSDGSPQIGVPRR